MESTYGATHSKRFVIEDSITRVSSDGQPHGLITIIAGGSGIIVAIIILAILVLVIGRRSQTQEATDLEARLTQNRPSIILPAQKQNICIATITGDTISCQSMRSSTSSDINNTSPRLSGEQNSAFVGEAVELSDNTMRKKKRAHWSDEKNQPLGVFYKATDPNIEIERF